MDHEGICDNNPVKNMDLEDTSGVVSYDDMTRFKDEGFKLTGKLLFSEAILDEDEEEEEENAPTPPSGPIHANRIVPEGYEYEADYDEDEEFESGGEEPPFEVEIIVRRDLGGIGNGTVNARDLAIIGNDDNRAAIPSASMLLYPNRYAGMLVFKKTGFQDRGCTGTIISDSSIITAGHW